MAASAPTEYVRFFEIYIFWHHLNKYDTEYLCVKICCRETAEHFDPKDTQWYETPIVPIEVFI